MSGYRTSTFDPNASARGGQPLRPFNWVQWSGVAMLVVGIVLLLAMIGASIDVPWLQRFRHFPAILPILIGQLLIYSRRQPYVDPAPELQRTRNQRMLLITVAVIAAVLGAAAAIQFSGA